MEYTHRNQVVGISGCSKKEVSPQRNCASKAALKVSGEYWLQDVLCKKASKKEARLAIKCVLEVEKLASETRAIARALWAGSPENVQV
jgi:hypothetical protein